MIKSMTGYGGGKSASPEYEFTVELKSVNNRFSDLNVRTPRGFLFAEDAVKSAVSARISRGKVDLFLSYAATTQSDVTVVANEALAAEYKTAIEHLAKQLGLDSGLCAYRLSKFPDILTPDKREINKDEALAALLTAVNLALDEHDSMRQREGEKLQDDIETRLTAIEKHITDVEKLSPKTVQEYRERLTVKMQEVLENKQLDEHRILLEAALFSDRVSVDEETVRLRSHISQMRELLSIGGVVGRKLDFLVQEMNREANTIGSKCNDGEITRVVLEIKSEIEKVREQVQNIE